MATEQGQSESRLISRQTYIDLVRAIVPRTGTFQELAWRVGITPPHLSALLRPETRHGQKLTPPPALAQRLVAALPVTAEERDILLHHLAQARQPTTLGEVKAGTVKHYLVAEKLVDDLYLAFDRGKYARDPVRARDANLYVWDAGHATLPFIDPVRLPLPHVCVLWLLSHTATNLGKPHLGLHYARTAQDILHDAIMAADWYLDPAMWHRTRLMFWLRMRVAEAEALRALRLHREAVTATRRAEDVPLFTADDWWWQPQLYRERIDALSTRPRFALSEAQVLYERGRTLAESVKLDDPIAYLETAAPLTNAMADAYLRHGSSQSLRRAEPLVQENEFELATHPRLGPLHRIALHRTASDFYVRIGATADATRHLTRALQIARGLNSPTQCHELWKRFGVEVPWVFARSAAALGP